jgi:hypothetical protein
MQAPLGIPRHLPGHNRESDVSVLFPSTRRNAIFAAFAPGAAKGGEKRPSARSQNLAWQKHLATLSSNTCSSDDTRSF